MQDFSERMTIHTAAISKGASSCNRCLRVLIRLCAIGLLLPAAVRAQEADAAPLDIFIGMVIADGENLVLERCNIVRTRYRLLPAAGAGDPLAELRGKTGKVQAHVIASYRADGEAHILDVAAIDNVRLGKTCHLLDAIDESFEKADAWAEAGPEAAVAAAEASEASTPDADRWDALAAGAAAPAGGEVIGSGAYAYRFVLLQPRTGKPAAHTDYALSASRATDYELPFVTDQKKVFQGRTDEEGRTPVFRLPVRLPDAAFDLRERFGSGPYGETFHLTDHNDNDLFNAPYALITCTSPPRFFRGYTYPNGDTAYTASDGPINVQLRVLDNIDEALPASCEDGRNEDGDHAVLPTTREKDTD